LCRDADRAGVEMTLAHHDATLDNQRCRGKTEFVRTEQRADHNVAAGLHLTVGLNADAATQLVEHQRLLGFSQTEFPRGTGMLDRGDG